MGNLLLPFCLSGESLLAPQQTTKPKPFYNVEMMNLRASRPASWRPVSWRPASWRPVSWRVWAAFLLVWVAALCLGPPSARAQIKEVGDGGPGPFKADHLTAELVTLAPQIAPGGNLQIGLLLTIEDGWHVYWINAGDSGEPPKIIWTLPKGITAGPMQFPVPERLPYGPTDGFRLRRPCGLSRAAERFAQAAARQGAPGCACELAGMQPKPMSARQGPPGIEPQRHFWAAARAAGGGGTGRSHFADPQAAGRRPCTPAPSAMPSSCN